MQVLKEDVKDVVNTVLPINWLLLIIMKVKGSQGEANLVPAAAVIRGPLVFDHVTRCTRPQRMLVSSV